MHTERRKGIRLVIFIHNSKVFYIEFMISMSRSDKVCFHLGPFSSRSSLYGGLLLTYAQCGAGLTLLYEQDIVL